MNSVVNHILHPLGDRLLCEPLTPVPWAEAVSTVAELASCPDCLAVDPSTLSVEDRAHERHNHVTRDIRRPGLCPACDRYWAAYPPES